MNPPSGILQIGHIYLKNDNDVTICRHDVIVKIFWCCFVSLIKFSYCSKIHVNIDVGSGVMTDFFMRNSLEIWKLEKLLPEFCPISGDWGKLGIQKYPE